MKKETIVVISGYFNPIHVGHIRYIKKAKKLGTKLIVIVNSDYQVKLKGSYPFMSEKERLEILSNIKGVDNVLLSVDKDKSVSKTLKLLKPDIFANGGDRNLKDAKNPKSSLYQDMKTCNDLGIKMVYNVGGSKIQASSDLIKKCLKNKYESKSK